MKKIYLLLADGFELIEALTPVDVLRRGKLDVVTVSITKDKEVNSAQKVKVLADTTIYERDITDGDMIVLPGGYPGYINLGNSKEVADILKVYEKNNKYIGAICGAPTVLEKSTIYSGKVLTCHTSVVEEMKEYKCTENKTEVCDKLITGMGAGVSLEFAFRLAEAFLTEDEILQIKKGMEIL